MAGEVKLEEYTDIYAERWDRFVLKESINGTFLQTRKFLNYHPKDRFTDSSLVFLCGNNIVAVLPANYNLAERKIVSHQGSTYGGLILSKNSCKIQTLDMIFNELDSYFKARKVKKISIAQTGSIYQRQKTSLIDYYFFLNGYESLAEIGYYIDVSDPNKNLIEDFSASRRRDYRYSLKNSFQFRTLNSDKDIEGFYKILLDSYIKNPRTIILSTHLINEVENLIENVVIIHKGKVIVDDSIDNISQKSFYISGDKSDLEKLKCLKNTTPDKSFGSKQVYKYYGDINEDDLKFIESLNINLETMNLQDMFVHLTKRGNTNE